MTSHDRTRNFGALLTELMHGSADLLRSEVKLARLELSDVASNTARGVAFVALGGVLLVLGGLAFIAGLVLLVGDQWLPRDRYWLASLVVLVLTASAALWAMKRGRSHLAPSALVPDETIETLKEDKEWLKRQLTSGATSS